MFDSEKQRIFPLASNPIWLNLVVVIATSIFLASVGYFLLLPAIDQAQKNAIDFQHAYAVHTKDLIDLYAKNKLESMKFLGSQILVNQKDPSSVDKLVQLFFNSRTDFLTVEVYDLKGTPIVNLTRDSSASGFANVVAVDSIFFSKALSDDIYFSPVYHTDKGPVIKVSAPLQQNGQTEAVMISEINLSLLQQIANTPVIENGKVYITDQNGTLIADPDPQRASSGIDLKYREIVQRLVSGEEVIPQSSYKNENGIKTLASGLKVPVTDWNVVVEQSEQEAFSQKNQTILATGAFTLGSFVLIALLLIGAIRLNSTLISLRHEEKKLLGEKDKLSLTLSAITDGVIAVDLSRNIIIFNRAAEKLTGYHVGEVLGKNIDDVIKVFDRGEGQIPSSVYCPISLNTTEEGIIYSRNDLKIITNTKEAFVNMLSGQIKESTESNLGSILTLHNVSQERQLEEMKLDFVSMAAHELRTPLTAIKGYVYIFIKDYMKQMNEKQATMLQRLSISAQKLSTLVENLLSISRIESGSLTVNLQPTDWIESVKSTILEVEPQIKDKKLEFTADLPQFLPKVYVDPLRIEEVLSNLLTNAVSYTAPGGKVRVWVEQQGQEIITHVSDTGEGIPEEALPHIFTKFFRVSGSLEQGSKGTGLGLYIAKSIINMHHGRVWVQSEFGKGSTFSFALPVFKQG